MESKETINNGNIIGSVFGGAKGSNTFTPYVKGSKVFASEYNWSLLIIRSSL